MTTSTNVQISGLSGSARFATATVSVGQPAVKFKVQLLKLATLGRPAHSFFTSCVDKPELECTIEFKPSSAEAFDCVRQMASIIETPRFFEGVIGPLLKRLQPPGLQSS